MVAPEIRFDVRVHVGSFSFISFSRLAPFLDELNKRYVFVAASVSDFEPPASGFTEIAITLAVAAPAAYFSSFLATWAAEDAKALRRKMLDLFDLGKVNSHGRRYVPMRVELGRVRFYFHEQLDDEELVTRLKAAQDFVASLPEVAFEGLGGPGEYGLFWDRKLKSWRGGIHGYQAGYCVPERVLSDDPGDLICYES